VAQERRIRREAFLRALYEKADGSTRAIVYGVGEAIGLIDERELLDVARRLEHEGMLEFKTTGFGLSITPAGVEVVEENFEEGSLERQRVAERKLDCLAMLRAAYEATDGSDMTSFNYRDLGREFGWDGSRLERAMESLVDDGMIEHWTMGGNMRMTMEGIEFVEEDR
jgi:predicted transcriptional regulator